MKTTIFATIFLFVCLFLTIQIVAIPKAKKDIEAIFTKYGFSSVQIKEAQFNINGLTIPLIKLDKDGFSKIENMQATIFWPTYIFKPEINAIDASNIHVASTTKEIAQNINVIKKLMLNIKSKDDIKRISFKKLTWDVSTQYGPIRLQGDVDYYNRSVQTLLLNLYAEQNQLAFNSQWQFESNENNEIYAQGNFSDLKVNMPPFVLNRGNGWASLSPEDGLTAQMDAGNGTLFKLPLQSINLISSSNDDYHDLIIRSKVTGNIGTTLSADVRVSKNINSQDFNMRFQSNDFLALSDYLSQKSVISNSLKEKITFEILLFTADYLKDRRFADGPWPFEINVSNQNSDTATGVFLFYPNSQEMRGSAQGDVPMIDFLKTILAKEGQESSDNIIRLDENLKTYFIQ